MVISILIMIKTIMILNMMVNIIIILHVITNSINCMIVINFTITTIVSLSATACPRLRWERQHTMTPSVPVSQPSKTHALPPRIHTKRKRS